MTNPELENEAALLMGRLLGRAAQQIDAALGTGTASANPAMVETAADGMLKALIVKQVTAIETRHVQALADFHATLCKLETHGMDVEVAQSIAQRYVCVKVEDLERQYRDALSDLLRKAAGLLRPAWAAGGHR